MCFVKDLARPERRAEMATAEVYPFSPLADTSAFPPWIRGLRKKSGVYIIRARSSESIAYIGESSTNRLYATLTRHFQRWSNKYHTAGATYDRGDIEVAVIVVPNEHAHYLQNTLICELKPDDNRLICNELFDSDEPETYNPPDGYDYDLDLLLQGIAYEWPDGDLDDVPF